MARQSLVEQVAGREVDRDLHWPPGVSPSAGLVERAVQNVAHQWSDQPCVLREWDELVGLDQSPDRMLPPNQGLNSHHVSSADADLRLVVQHEFVSCQRSPQVAEQSELRRGVPVHGRVIREDAPGFGSWPRTWRCRHAAAAVRRLGRGRRR
jgi:hypothetical protein